MDTESHESSGARLGQFCHSSRFSRRNGGDSGQQPLRWVPATASRAAGARGGPFPSCRLQFFSPRSPPSPPNRPEYQPRITRTSSLTGACIDPKIQKCQGPLLNQPLVSPRTSALVIPAPGPFVPSSFRHPSAILPPSFRHPSIVLPSFFRHPSILKIYH